MLIKESNGIRPRFEGKVYVAENAAVIGDVVIGEDSSVWYGAVIRADGYPVRIGKRVAVEDNVTIHDRTTLGDDILVGHNAVLHGCTVESGCTIGMHATVLDGAVIGEGSMIGAHALVTHNMIIPPGSVAFGAPAKVMGKAGEEYRKSLEYGITFYLSNSPDQLDLYME